MKCDTNRTDRKCENTHTDKKLSEKPISRVMRKPKRNTNGGVCQTRRTLDRYGLLREK